MNNSIDSEANGTSMSDAVPIREISRATGVNTVTLRAWERRYGLLVPQRTAKGHRLYSDADIERVKEIQLWLGRGLAISKVKALLADEQRGDRPPDIDSNWLQLAQQIHVAITAFNRKQLERLIEEIFSLYPLPFIADYLLTPVLMELHGDEPGKPVRRAFFSAVVMEYIQAAQSRQRQAAQGVKILSVAAGQQESCLLQSVLNYALLVNQFQAEFMGYLNARESLLAAEALGAKIVIIMGGDTISTSELQLHLSAWRERSSPALLLVGGVAQILRAYSPELQQGIHLCATQQQVLGTIKQLVNDGSLV